MIAHATGQTLDPRDTIFPNVYDGIEGVEFIEQCVASSADNGSWQPLSC